MTTENQNIDPVQAIGDLREALERSRTERGNLPGRFSPLLEAITVERNGRQAAEAEIVRLKAQLTEMECRNEHLAALNADLGRENQTMAMAMMVAVREIGAGDAFMTDKVDEFVNSILETSAAASAPRSIVEQVLEATTDAPVPSARVIEQLANGLPELERALAESHAAEAGSESLALAA